MIIVTTTGGVSPYTLYPVVQSLRLLLGVWYTVYRLGTSIHGKILYLVLSWTQ